MSYYDEIGNPTSYLGWSFDWMGRSLTEATKGSQTLSYTYNSGGIRTSKTVNGVKTEYLLNGTQILAQKTGNDVMWFFYDQQGNRVGMADSSNHIYYYLYNLQGDVIALADAETGKLAATYTYDAWGKIVSVKNASGYTIGTANPFRYRGYYYDNETGLYYLNSRYYNPEVGRFISEDAYFSFDNLLGYNLFAYCNNNPVNCHDPMGKNAAAATTWATTMYWLTMVDDPAIVGDTIFAIGLAVCGIIIVDAADNSPPANSKPSNKPSSKPSSKSNRDDPTNVDDKDTTSHKPSTPSRGDTPKVKYPGNDGSKSPGENYEWRGPEPVGGDKGAWVNRRTGESWHPDLNHGAPMGPHWDYKDIFRVFWRIFPDGRILPR